MLLIFLDGVGIGESDSTTNAFAVAALPHLEGLLDGRRPLQSHLDGEGRIVAPRVILRAADATLGVPGRPQSGTGQTALLTGANAPHLFGRHFGSWVPTALRPLLDRDNLFTRAIRTGRRAAFANALPPSWISGTPRRPGAFPLAARAAGIWLRGRDALRERQAVSSSLTNHRWRELFGTGIPNTSAAEAGATLAELANSAELTVFAHYDTDMAGHRRDLAAAVSVLEQVDRFLGSVLGNLADDALLLITSDHGNLEDTRVGHTRNPVPLIAVGPGRELIAEQVRDTTHLAPALDALWKST